MRLFQSHGKLQSSPAPAPGPSLCLYLSVCLCYRFPPLFPIIICPLVRAKSLQTAALLPFLPLVLCSHGRLYWLRLSEKRSRIGPRRILACFLCSTPRSIAAITTDIPRRATAISLTRTGTRARAKTSAQPNPIAVLFEHRIVIGYTAVGRLRNILPGTLHLIPSPRRTS